MIELVRLISSSFKYTFMSAFICLCIGSSTNAGLKLDDGLVQAMIAGGTSTPLVLSGEIVIANTTVAGWQTSLRIMPDGFAMGTVAFSSVSEPSSNYVLGSVGDGVTFTLATDTTTNDQVRAFDFDGPSGGVAGVSHNVGANVNIGSVVFSASANAAGNFGLYAIDVPSYRTQWSDLTGGLPAQTVQFTNVPRDSSPVRLGTISVTAIPEPGAWLFALVAICGVILQRFRSTCTRCTIVCCKQRGE
jgi:hypothetical protein